MPRPQHLAPSPCPLREVLAIETVCGSLAAFIVKAFECRLDGESLNQRLDSESAIRLGRAFIGVMVAIHYKDILLLGCVLCAPHRVGRRIVVAYEGPITPAHSV